MRYYLLTKYIIPIYVETGIGSMSMTSSINGSFSEKQKFYEKDKMHPYPKTERLCTVSNDLFLYKAFFDIDRGYFVIKAKERKLAYDIATIIRYIINIRNGYQPDDKGGNYFLQELKRLPQPNWDEKRMLSELSEYNPYAREVLLFDLKDGVYIEYEIFNMIPEVISKIHDDQSLINSMYHLLESRLIFAGFMTGSYYSSHYKNDRLDTPGWEMEKRYFEYRYRYESAFIAAFKGIECFLQVNDIKKHEIKSVLENCGYDTVKPTNTYRRFHEVFSDQKENIPYTELIEHFLKLRNVVAAHGNQTPPDQYKIIEDNIFEIQLFLEHLINSILFED